jgi:hypothetical protein
VTEVEEGQKFLEIKTPSFHKAYTGCSTDRTHTYADCNIDRAHTYACY